MPRVMACLMNMLKDKKLMLYHVYIHIYTYVILMLCMRLVLWCLSSILSYQHHT
jgi:hypothetical protein